MAHDMPLIGTTGAFIAGQQAPGRERAKEKPTLDLPHIDSQNLVDSFITTAQIWSPSGHERVNVFRLSI